MTSICKCFKNLKGTDDDVIDDFTIDDFDGAKTNERNHKKDGIYQNNDDDILEPPIFAPTPFPTVTGAEFPADDDTPLVSPGGILAVSFTAQATQEGAIAACGSQKLLDFDTAMSVCGCDVTNKVNIGSNINCFSRESVSCYCQEPLSVVGLSNTDIGVGSNVVFCGPDYGDMLFYSTEIPYIDFGTALCTTDVTVAPVAFPTPKPSSTHRPTLLGMFLYYSCSSLPSFVFDSIY